MSTTYTVAGPEVDDLLARVLASAHRDLENAGVTVASLFAEADEEGKPALKHHGYAAAAVIKIVPLDQRVAGQADALLKIDRHVWDGLDTKERVALLDHEIFHIQLVLDDQGKPKRDDAGRPKLKMRPHDFELGGFYEIIERHGGKAIELQEYAKVHKQLVQQELFPAE